MIKKKLNKIVFINILISVFLLITPFVNSAKEVLIYADNISYDEDKNIIARGNAKVFIKDQFIISDLIIYKNNIEEILLPTDFTLRDNQNNNADHMDTIKVVGDNLYGSGQRYIGSSKYHGMVWTLPSDGSLQGTYGHFTYGAFTHGMSDSSFPASAPGASTSDCSNCAISAAGSNALSEETTGWSIQQFEEVE